MTLKLQIDMVPKELHGVNLRNELGNYAWSKLRKRYLQNYDGLCSVCSAEVSKPHLHEDWSYTVTDEVGTARVEALNFVCFYCHGCEHFGWLRNFALLPSTIEDVLSLAKSHFCRVNGVSGDVFEKHLKEADEIWEQRNHIEWHVDWGEFSSAVGERKKRQEKKR